MLHEINLKPALGGRRIAIIDDADYLNDEGANALLKTIEEPPPRSVLILIGASPAKQLPTIRSRCQLIRFRPLPLEVVAELLVSRGFVRTGETTTGGLSRFSSDGGADRRLVWDCPLRERLAGPKRCGRSESARPV